MHKGIVFLPIVIFAIKWTLILTQEDSEELYLDNYDKFVKKMESKLKIMSPENYVIASGIHMMWLKEGGYLRQLLINTTNAYENQFDLMNTTFTNQFDLMNTTFTKHVGSLNETTMLLCAGRDLRYRLETFGTDANVQAGAIIDRFPGLRTVLKKMRASVNRRKLTLCTSVMDLYDLYLRYLPDTVAWHVDKSNWELEVKIVYRRLKKIPANEEPQNDVTTLSLQNLILTFQTAKDETAAVEVFEKQCASCYWSSIDTDFVDENHGLKKLAASLPESEKVRLTSDDALAGIDPTAKTLATNLLNSETYFTMDSDGGKRYANCVEVFLFAKDKRYLSSLKIRMHTRWPDLEDKYDVLVDRFCSRFSALYNKISNTDIHAPGECEPDSSHIYRFIKKMRPVQELRDDFVFVAQVVGAILYDYEPPRV